jgi:DNA invertase Pin-like site-specific DNA recombinase
VSEDVQRQAIEAMAARDGVTISTWYKDWDRSADESKSKRRTEYAAMLRAIEACEVGTVYAYAVDRLYRSLTGFLRLTEAANRCGARIVTSRDGIVGGDGSPMAAAFAQIGAVFTELELSTAKARARAAYAARVARGDHVGQIPYGHRLVKVDGVNRIEDDPERPIAPIIEAYARANGRIRTTVRILNDELRLPAPYGGQWDRPSVLRLIEREAPELLPPRTASGRRDAPATPALLAKLLRCHCGRLLTPNRHVEKRHGTGAVTVSYYCARGNSMPVEHGRPYYVAESMVLPFVRAEADRLQPPKDAPSDADNAARRAALDEKRRRLALVFADGGIDELTYHRQRKVVEAEAKALDAASRPLPVPGRIDWADWPTENINAVLRAMFDHIQLDRSLRPVEAVWLVPEWRGAS